MKLLEELAARRRFGMRLGLDAIDGVCAALGRPEWQLGEVIHIAGTNGKGAVAAILDAKYQGGRYTSPHLVKLNERFFLKGQPIDEAMLERAAARVGALPAPLISELTFFEALTAVAFLIYAEAKPSHVILETGLGGRLDATNVCKPALSVITRIGLDHCDWLGDSVEKIAAEKAGIIKRGIPVVLGLNDSSVCEVVERRAKEMSSPFYYAPDMVSESEIPEGFSLAGNFNRENVLTAIAALKVLGDWQGERDFFRHVVWPARFQVIGEVIVDGAHNPPAARALSASLPRGEKFNLIAGFCGDKDVGEVLTILKEHVSQGFAVRTQNPRSLTAEVTAAKMQAVGISAVGVSSLNEALCRARETGRRTLVCGSLFLAGEALVALNAYPWGKVPKELQVAELLNPCK